jgi:hypothetical protein
MLRQSISASLHDDLRNELQDLLDRISQDMFHPPVQHIPSAASSSNSFSDTFLEPPVSAAVEYKHYSDQENLSEIKTDHVTQEQSQFLNACAEELCAFGPQLQKRLQAMNTEVSELHKLQQHVSKMMEHWDMIAPFWVGDEICDLHNKPIVF